MPDEWRVHNVETSLERCSDIERLTFYNCVFSDVFIFSVYFRCSHRVPASHSTAEQLVVCFAVNRQEHVCFI